MATRNPVDALFDAFIEAAPKGATLRRSFLGVEVRVETPTIRQTPTGQEVRKETDLLVTWPTAKDRDGDPCVYAIHLPDPRDELERLIRAAPPMEIAPPDPLDTLRFLQYSTMASYKPPKIIP
jgi:hypothetical protein